jgi:hypothetical protein
MRTFLVSSWLIAGIFFTGAFSWAAETDADRLLELLVEKKVLTREDASAFRADLAIKKQDEKQPASVPDWVQNVKLKGDFRARYQYDKTKNAASVASERHRERIRLRLGADTKVVDGFNVGFGIATGTTSDPKSTNITLGDGLSFKNIVLDYAYGQYAPKWRSPVELSLTAGKFKNPFWEPIGALVDNDINPEGVASQLSYKAGDRVNVFLNYGFITLSESLTDLGDPILNVIQPGVDWKVSDNVKVKSTLDFWLANGIKDHTPISYSPGSNSTGRLSDQNSQTSSIVYLNDYKVIVPKLEVGFTGPFFGFNTGFPYFSVFGEYLNNVSPSAKKTGWIAGFKLGHEKVSDKNQWQLLYDHRFIEKDAFLDIFTDSEFYGGKTNAFGEDVRFNYGLSKNSWITLSYYYSKNRTRLTNNSESSRLPIQTFEADWNIKF